jgi:hypothetical protein
MNGAKNAASVVFEGNVGTSELISDRVSPSKTKPPEPDGIGGFSHVAPTGLGTRAWGFVRLACVEYRRQIRKEMSPP